jgi:hypothetical protein
MTSPYPNQGVHISGGNVQGSVANTGSGSTVSQRYVRDIAAADDDLTGRLDRLAGLIRTHQETIADWEYALGDLDDIRANLGQARPDRPRLRDSLARLGQRVAAAVPVATAVADLATTIINLAK